jgi:predicted dehydrogenase
MSGERLNVAVIGLGIGRWHAESYRDTSNARLVALCDVDANRLASGRERYGVEKTYTSYEALCDDPTVDAVSVCVPNHLHAPISIYALEHGKHVLCEKPLANSVANAEAMVAAARRSGRVAMVAMKFRYTPEAVTIRRLVEDGELGEIYYGWTTYLRQLGGIPGMGGWFTRKPMSGGGPMIDNGVHFLDLLWWLMGCPTPTRVSGATYAKFGPRGKGASGWNRVPMPEEFSVEDLATAMIRFDNGASVLMDNGWAGFVPGETIGVRLMGTEGGATLWPYGVTGESDGKVVDRTPDASQTDAPSQFHHFADCALNGKTPISSFENCLEVTRMLDAVYRSAEAGTDVPI